MLLDILTWYANLLPFDCPSLNSDGDEGWSGLLWWELKAFLVCSVAPMTCEKVPGLGIPARIL